MEEDKGNRKTSENEPIIQVTANEQILPSQEDEDNERLPDSTPSVSGVAVDGGGDGGGGGENVEILSGDSSETNRQPGIESTFSTSSANLFPAPTHFFRLDHPTSRPKHQNGSSFHALAHIQDEDIHSDTESGGGVSDATTATVGDNEGYQNYLLQHSVHHISNDLKTSSSSSSKSLSHVPPDTNEPASSLNSTLSSFNSGLSGDEQRKETSENRTSAFPFDDSQPLDSPIHSDEEVAVDKSQASLASTLEETAATESPSQFLFMENLDDEIDDESDLIPPSQEPLSTPFKNSVKCLTSKSTKDVIVETSSNHDPLLKSCCDDSWPVTERAAASFSQSSLTVVSSEESETKVEISPIKVSPLCHEPASAPSSLSDTAARRHINFDSDSSCQSVANNFQHIEKRSSNKTTVLPPQMAQKLSKITYENSLLTLDQKIGESSPSKAGSQLFIVKSQPSSPETLVNDKEEENLLKLDTGDDESNLNLSDPVSEKFDDDGAAAFVEETPPQDLMITDEGFCTQTVVPETHEELTPDFLCEDCDVKSCEENTSLELNLSETERTCASSPSKDILKDSGQLEIHDDKSVKYADIEKIQDDSELVEMQSEVKESIESGEICEPGCDPSNGQTQEDPFAVLRQPDLSFREMMLGLPGPSGLAHTFRPIHDSDSDSDSPDRKFSEPKMSMRELIKSHEMMKVWNEGTPDGASIRGKGRGKKSKPKEPTKFVEPTSSKLKPTDKCTTDSVASQNDSQNSANENEHTNAINDPETSISEDKYSFIKPVSKVLPAYVSACTSENVPCDNEQTLCHEMPLGTNSDIDAGLELSKPAPVFASTIKSSSLEVCENEELHTNANQGESEEVPTKDIGVLKDSLSESDVAMNVKPEECDGIVSATKDKSTKHVNFELNSNNGARMAQMARKLVAVAKKRKQSSNDLDDICLKKPRIGMRRFLKKKIARRLLPFSRVVRRTSTPIQCKTLDTSKQLVDQVNSQNLLPDKPEEVKMDMTPTLDKHRKVMKVTTTTIKKYVVVTETVIDGTIVNREVEEFSDDPSVDEKVIELTNENQEMMLRASFCRSNSLRSTTSSSSKGSSVRFADVSSSSNSSGFKSTNVTPRNSDNHAFTATAMVNSKDLRSSSSQDLSDLSSEQMSARICDSWEKIIPETRPEDLAQIRTQFCKTKEILQSKNIPGDFVQLARDTDSSGKDTIKTTNNALLTNAITKSHDQNCHIPEKLNSGFSTRSSDDESAISESSVKLRTAREVSAGVKVFAKWNDGNYYSGKATEKEISGRWVVKFDDGNLKQVKETEICAIDQLPAGLSVYAKLKDNYFDSGIILNVAKKKRSVVYTVELDTGVENRVQLPASSLMMTLDQIRCLSGDELEDDNITTNISLKNILTTKRREGFSPAIQKCSSGMCDAPNSHSKTTCSSMLTPTSLSLTSKQKHSTNKSLATSLLNTSSRKRSRNSHSEKDNDSSMQISKRSLIKDFEVLNSGIETTLLKTTVEDKGDKSHLGPLPTDQSSLFKGLKFWLTQGEKKPSSFDGDTMSVSSNDSFLTSEDEVAAQIPFSKSYLKQQIIAGGGVILNLEHLNEVNHQVDCYLISNSYVRTSKYFHCLALGIPCVSHLWIIDSCKNSALQKYTAYMLPAGYSILTKKTVEWHMKKDIFSKLKIMLVSSQNKEMKTVWLPITSAAGATIIPRLSTSVCSTIQPDVIVTDTSCPLSVARRANKLHISLVSTEWIVQCLISGICLPFDSHPEFKYDHVRTSQ